MAYSRVRTKVFSSSKNRFPSCLAASFILPDCDEYLWRSSPFQKRQKRHDKHKVCFEEALCSIRFRENVFYRYCSCKIMALACISVHKTDIQKMWFVTIKLERGVKQGYLLSPYLFILFVEIFAETMRKNKNIKGIAIDEQEIKISQMILHLFWTVKRLLHSSLEIYIEPF